MIQPSFGERYLSTALFQDLLPPEMISMSTETTKRDRQYHFMKSYQTTIVS